MGSGKPPITERRPSAPDEGKSSPPDAVTTEIVQEFRLEIAHGVATALVRRAVSQVLETWRVMHCADDALLVATELVGNLSRHTVGGGELRMALRHDIILIEVTDTDPQLPVLHEYDPHRLGGRGLIIVAGVARRWGYRPASWVAQHGKVVWAELQLHPPRTPTPA